MPEAQARRRPGPVPAFSREQVIAAGLEVLAHDGARNVSFRTVALRLGVRPNALYTYVADKDDLLAGMLDAALSAVDVPRAEDDRPAAQRLVDMMVSLRRLLIANADLFNMAPTAALTGRAALDSFDALSATLKELVDDDREAAALYTSLVDQAVGSAMTAARARSRVEESRQLVERISTAEHPQSASMGRASLEVDRDALFVRSLHLLLGAAAPAQREGRR